MPGNKLVPYRFFLLPLWLILWAAGPLHAQKETSIWYFGYGCGLDFNSGSPVPVSDGEVDTKEGTASVCDREGRLLFYTDGITVWSRDHKIMPNGQGLMGHESSTQSAIIVPFPGDTSRYYLFTSALQSMPPGICYNIVDMNLNKGYGDIVAGKKNIILLSPATERLTAVRDRDGMGYWVVSHEFNNSTFYAWHISTSGIGPPVTSTAGSVHGPFSSSATGAMKLSPDGRKLAVCIFDQGILEVFDFNITTGEVSDPRKLLHMEDDKAYGAEFSHDGRLLYATAWSGQVIQFDLDKSSWQEIIDSRTHIKVKPYSAGLQMGLDGKIYISKQGSKFLDAIAFPDKVGEECSYVKDLARVTGLTKSGLPNFVSSLFTVSFTYQHTCKGDMTLFSLTNTQGIDIDSVVWDFGEPESMSGNNSRERDASHRYLDTGAYDVKLRVYTPKGNFATSQRLFITSIPDPWVKGDTIVCPSDSFYLDAQTGGAAYEWQDGSRAPDMLVNKPGLYSVKIKKGGCEKIFYKHIRYPGAMFLADDTTLCEGQAFTFTADSLGGFSYRWHNGNTGRSYSTDHDEKIWLAVDNGRCHGADTLHVRFIPRPQLDLPADTVLCPGAEWLVDIPEGFSEVEWSDGSHERQRKISQEGTYSLKAISPCHTEEAVVRVEHLEQTQLTLGADSFICEGQPRLLMAGHEGDGFGYIWNDSTTGPHKSIQDSGTYIVYRYGPCGMESDTIHMAVEDCSCPVYLSNAFTPGGDSINEVWKPVMCPVLAYQLQVYNRWGELVFESDRLEHGWDGTFKGAPAAEGVYIYKLWAQDKYYNHKYRSGVLNLLR